MSAKIAKNLTLNDSVFIVELDVIKVSPIKRIGYSNLGNNLLEINYGPHGNGQLEDVIPESSRANGKYGTLVFFDFDIAQDHQLLIRKNHLVSLKIIRDEANETYDEAIRLYANKPPHNPFG